MGISHQRDKLRCMAEQWGCEFVDLETLPDRSGSRQAARPGDRRRYKAIPIDRSNGRIVLAMKEPNDIYAIDHIRVILGSDVEPVMALEEDILTAINRFHNTDSNVSEVISNALKDVNLDSIEVAGGGNGRRCLRRGAARAGGRSADRAPRQPDHQPRRARTAPATSTWSRPRRRAASATAWTASCRRRMTLPKKVQASLISRIKIMADMDIAEKRAPQDGRISLIIEGKQFDFRVSTLPVGVRREGRAPHPRQERAQHRPLQAGAAAQDAGEFETAHHAHLWHHPGHRPDRLR